MPAKKKVKKKLSNVERLDAAGVINQKDFTPEEIRSINHLGDADVDTLIRLRKKRGAVPPGRESIRPNVFL